MKPLKQSNFKLILIKDLGMKFPTPHSTQKKRFAEVQCPNCKIKWNIQVEKKSMKTLMCKSCTTKIRNTIHGKSATTNYSRWKNMKARCLNPRNPRYSNYGGRGISIYENWISNFDSYNKYINSLPFSNQQGRSIDRIENDTGYIPGNLRWATAQEQVINQRVRITNSSGFVGVRSTKFSARICVNYTYKHLGYFDTAEEAAIAYDSYIVDNNLPYITNKQRNLL